MTSFAAITAAHKHDCPTRSCNPKVNYYTAKYNQLYIVVQKCNILLTITCFPRYNFASQFNEKEKVAFSSSSFHAVNAIQLGNVFS